MSQRPISTLRQGCQAPQGEASQGSATEGARGHRGVGLGQRALRRQAWFSIMCYEDFSHGARGRNCANDLFQPRALVLCVQEGLTECWGVQRSSRAAATGARRRERGRSGFPTSQATSTLWGWRSTGSKERVRKKERGKTSTQQNIPGWRPGPTSWVAVVPGPGLLAATSLGWDPLSGPERRERC